MPSVRLDSICSTTWCLSSAQARWGGICTACHLDRKDTPVPVKPAAPAPPSLERAACIGADPELFFAAEGEEPSVRSLRMRAARAICGGCPVAMDCGQHALETHAIGVWNGQDENDRTRIRQQRGQDERRERAT